MAHTPHKSLFLILILMTAVPLLSLNMFLASLGVMAHEFGIGYDTLAMALSGYLIFTAFIQIIIGPIADRFGRRPVLLISLTLFSIASCGAALAESFVTFLIFRVFQGAIATGSTLSRAIVSDIIPPTQAASILGYLAMAMSLAPIIGPTIGGALAEIAGWRTNFWLYSTFGVGLWTLVWAYLPETGAKTGWTPRAFLSSYLELISRSDFWAYTLIMSLGIGAFFTFVTGVPLIAAKQFGMTQAQIGICVGTITCGFLVGSFLSGRYAAKFSIDTMILSGRFVACFGLLACIFAFLLGFVSPITFLGGTICVGVGNGLTSPSASLAIMSVRRDLSATASGLSGAVIVVVGAVMTGLTGIILNLYPTAFTLVFIMLILNLAGSLIAVWQSFRKYLITC